MNICTCLLLKNKISWANNNCQDLVQCRKHLIMTNSAVCHRMNTMICTCMNTIYHVNGSSDSKFNLRCPHTNNGKTNLPMSSDTMPFKVCSGSRR